MRLTISKQFTLRAASLGSVGAATLLMVACGGSGSSSSGLSITGVTSTGAALSGATVEARCANGTTGSATSSSTGTFTITLSGGTLPCMLRSSGTDASGNEITLHSIADTGTTTTNVTPLTELVVAAATGTSGSTPSTAFASFTSSTTTQSTLNTSKLTYAKTVVASAAAAAATAGGQTVNLTSIDPMKDSFTVGSSNDQLIDKLVAALKQNATSAQISQVIDSLSTAVQTAAKANPSDATAASTAASTQASATVSKPFAIANCPAVKNVPYRLVGLSGSYGISNSPTFGASTTSSSTSNTGSISWTYGNGSTATDTVTFSSTNACKFTAQSSGNYSVTGAFAPSGIFITSTTNGLSIGFPEQTIALSELAGTWSSVEYSTNGSTTGPWQNFQSLVTIDASGKVTSAKDCSGSTVATNSCVETTDTKPTFAVNADGGFDINGDSYTGRAFAFRSKSGGLMLVIPARTGYGMIIASKQNTLTTHPVDYQSVGYSAGASGLNTVTTSFSSFTMKVTASDAGSYTWLRTLLNGSTNNFAPTDVLNAPRAGLRYRASVTYTPTGSTTGTTSSAAIGLPIQGTGVVASISTGGTATPYLSLSVNDSK